MKNVALVTISLFILNAAPRVLAEAGADLCNNPTQARVEVCKIFGAFQKAFTDANYGAASNQFKLLKSKMTLDDPLAPYMVEYETKLSTAIAAQKVAAAAPAPIAKTPEPARRVAVRVGEYRSSDGYLKRSTAEAATFYSVAGAHAFYSGATLASFGDNDEDKKLFFYVGTISSAAISLGTFFAFDKYSENVRYGVPAGFVWGSGMGIGSGIVAGFMLHSYWKREFDFYKHDVGRAYLRSIWVGSTVGSLLGGALAYATELRPGQSAFIASASLWGGGIGMSGSGCFMARREPFPRPVRAWGTLAGHLTGLALSSYLVYGRDYAPKQTTVMWMNLGYFSGLASAFYVMALGTRGDRVPRNQSIAALSGGVVGLAAATILTLGQSPDTIPLRSPEHVSRPSLLETAQFGGGINEDQELMAQVSFKF